MNTVRKLVIAILTACGATVMLAVSDGTVTRAEWGTISTLAVGAFLTWYVPNDPAKVKEPPPERPAE
jgi:hypothetical protein